jgi:hypothetical protein
MCEGMIQHRLAEMKPRMGVRLGHPQELALDRWEEVLLHVGQDEEPWVRSRRYRTVVRRTVTSAWAGLPIAGAVRHRGHPRPLERRPQRRDFFLGSPRHGL